MSLTVVYKAQPESVSRVVSVLRKEGLNPVVMDNPSAVSLYAAKGTLRIRIAVPREEVKSARSVLRKWEDSREPKVRHMTGELRTQLFYSLLVTAGAAAGFAALGILRLDTLGWLVPVWFASFVLVANIKRISRKSKP